MDLVTFVRAWEILGTKEGRVVAKLDIQVETSADLPKLGDAVSGYIIAAGSIAQVVQEGCFKTLSGTDVWFASGESSGGGD